MLFDWTEILPAAVLDLSPLRQEICSYLLSLTGKQKPGYTHAMKTWGLKKNDFDNELAATMTELRNNLNRRGVHRFQDLDIG